MSSVSSVKSMQQFVHSQKTVTLDEVYRATEGTNRFGIYITILSMIHGYLSMLSYSIPFLTKFPEVSCSTHSDNCINFDSPNTIRNWVTHLKLFNESQFKLGLIGSSFFFGYLLGSVTLLRLPDRYG